MKQPHHFNFKFMKTRLKKEDLKALDLTVDLWNAIHKLEILHDADIIDFMNDIHSIQNRIMSRPERRVQIDKHKK